ncbi:MAG: DUF3306 domain-containing protein [Bacteroidota bacterium]
MAAAPPETGDSTSPQEEGLLRRWSRRKAQERRETPRPATAKAEETGATESSAPENPPDMPLLTDADMPPIESLDKNSDYRPFLSPGVSDALRTRALRRLFHSGPFNERCPLDSEFYDFRGEEPLGSVITHEMREEMERAAAALKEQARQALFEPDKPAAGPAASGPQPATNPTAAASPPEPGVVKEG